MIRRIIAPALAFTALASATAAQAQPPPCVQPADLADAVVYVMPVAYDAARTACARSSKSGAAFLTATWSSAAGSSESSARPALWVNKW